MERFILKKLLAWKNSPYRKPLIMKGVRQVGKTWILKEFGRRYYENTAYFNQSELSELLHGNIKSDTECFCYSPPQYVFAALKGLVFSRRSSSISSSS